MDKPNGFQIYIFERIKSLAPLYAEPIIPRRFVKKLLGKQNIPSKFHKEFLEDFESYGWISFHNQNNIKILCNEEDQRDIKIIKI